MKKKERGMGCNRIDKVAEMPVVGDWQILRNFRSIDHGMAILAYISSRGVSESIHHVASTASHMRSAFINLVSILDVPLNVNKP
jgi:hypothetical protein